MKQRYYFSKQHLSFRLLGLFVLLFATAIPVYYWMCSTDFDQAKKELLVRRIGHELLLESGDQTSRVLPISHPTAEIFEMHFEHPFAFQPENLVKITKKVLNQNKPFTDFIVTVYRCAQTTPVYGFAIAKNTQNDIITCLGRKQPKACYYLTIQFQSNTIFTYNRLFYFLGIGLLAIFMFIYFGTKRKSTSASTANYNGEPIVFGKFTFDYIQKQLNIEDVIIPLTGTETRLLLIFATAPNQVIARDRLQKEIWEDEGVIVGRSLDMFISKLRKKLELDPNTNLLVVRSRGYKLEISE
ncbi:MAG: hypothetical protein RLZZ500_421 [Bacteroidota bacterium]|jgi:DNA-binding winged helix-turn-helix (wHTH) protein